MPYSASCLCRSVRFSFSDIEGDYVYCHCEDCKKASGSAFGANIAVKVDGFKLDSGESFIQTYESSPGKHRQFCGQCGSPLYTIVGENPEYYRVRLGVLDSVFETGPKAEIFTSDKAPWQQTPEHSFSHWPDPSSANIPGSRQSKD